MVSVGERDIGTGCEVAAGNVVERGITVGREDCGDKGLIGVDADKLEDSEDCELSAL